MKAYVILIVLSAVSAEHILEKPCKRHCDDGYGDCRPIEDCPTYFQNRDSQRAKEAIRRSECGLSNRKRLVCCPTSTSQFENLNKSSEVVASPLLPDRATCGTYTENKIVGGTATNLDEFPWMALLIYNDTFTPAEFHCGGVLISKRYVLTAAHCMGPHLDAVRLGEYDLRTDPDCVEYRSRKSCAPRAIDIPIEEKIVFPSFEPTNDATNYHDIALLRLKTEVEFSRFIKPICLPTTVGHISKDYTGKKLTVAGWGLINPDSTKSAVKMKVDLSVIVCKEKYETNITPDNGQFCTLGPGKRDACKGDSGGPLMAAEIENGVSHYVTVGVISIGPFPCASATNPGLYTRVSKYIYWIVDNLKP